MFIVCIIHVAEYVFESGNPSVIISEFIKPNIFTNGGDWTNEEIPESMVCKKYGIEILDGLGKKIRSSSDLTGLKSI